MRRTIDRLADPPRCPHCGSAFTSRSRRREGYFCHSCWRSFEPPTEVPFDFVADGWTAELAALQAAGEVIGVALPNGFVGVCVISTTPLLMRREIPSRREVVTR
ncbi:MAG TPA: hypothetical protein VNN19_06240 [bacterium]|nr:hypothetical protein [bacterium]